MPRPAQTTRIEPSPDSRRPYGKGKLSARAAEARERIAARETERRQDDA